MPQPPAGIDAGTLVSARLPGLRTEADRATSDLLARAEDLPPGLPEMLKNGFDAEQAMANLRDV
jgi:hypothetical protein